MQQQTFFRQLHNSRPHDCLSTRLSTPPGTPSPFYSYTAIRESTTMAQYFSQPPPQNPPASPYGGATASAQNLQFYSSSYAPGTVSGHDTPSQAAFGYGGTSGPSSGYGAPAGGYGFGASAGVSGRMGEQGGLRTGWLAAFGTEGYEGEPPLLVELGVNFGHIRGKVSGVFYSFFQEPTRLRRSRSRSPSRTGSELEGLISSRHRVDMPPNLGLDRG